MNPFTWIDLSTFNVNSTRQFYQKVFGWKFETTTQYVYCYKGLQTFAGLYEMPDFFKQINMPSFWMNYIKVKDIQKTMTLAKTLNARVELFETVGKRTIALIRDPLGAGFTCYQDETELQFNRKRNIWYWSELFVSDIEQVKPFYQELFSWEFKNDKYMSDRYYIYLKNQPLPASIQQLSTELREEKEYWSVFFLVNSLEKVAQKIIQAGGIAKIEQSFQTPQGHMLFCTDPNDASLGLIEI